MVGRIWGVQTDEDGDILCPVGGCIILERSRKCTVQPSVMQVLHDNSIRDQGAKITEMLAGVLIPSFIVAYIQLTSFGRVVRSSWRYASSLMPGTSSGDLRAV
jgi:hypothetical protein